MNKNNEVVKVFKKRGRKKKINITTLPSSLNLNINNEFAMNNLDELKYDLLEKNKDNIILKKKNVIINERLKTLNIILDICPALKKDRIQILNAVLEKVEDKKESYIVEKILGFEFNAYVDQDCNILDENVNLIGIFSKLQNKYYLFNDLYTNNKKICDFKKIII